MNSFKTPLLTVMIASLLFSAERVAAHYDPGTQRWLNRDPLREGGFETLRRKKTSLFQQPAERVAGRNLYTFVGNNCVNATDPLGLKDLCRAGNPLLGTGLNPVPLGTGVDYGLGAAAALGIALLAPEALGALDALAARLAFAAAAQAYEAQVAATAAAAATLAKLEQSLSFMNEYSEGYEQAEAAVETAERSLHLEQLRLDALMSALNKAAQTLGCMQK